MHVMVISRKPYTRGMAWPKRKTESALHTAALSPPSIHPSQKSHISSAKQKKCFLPVPGPCCHSRTRFFSGVPEFCCKQRTLDWAVAADCLTWRHCVWACKPNNNHLVLTSRLTYKLHSSIYRVRDNTEAFPYAAANHVVLLININKESTIEYINY
jgi:hypothetical protein